MKGHIQKRGKESWRLKFDLGTDPLTNERRRRYVTVRGTKREAQDHLNAILAAVNHAGDDKQRAQLALAGVLAELAGAAAEPGALATAARVVSSLTDGGTKPTALTVKAHVLERIEQWQASGQVTPRTAERYRELANNQIVPHLGAKFLVDLKPLDIEAWHTTLKMFGRLKGGGLSPRTTLHAHRLLSKALKDGVANEQVARNVAALKGAPRVQDEGEVAILTSEQVGELLVKLRGRAIYGRAIVCLFTGLRRGEMLALRWGNVDLDGKLIRVREAIEETKAGLRFKKPKTKSGVRNVTLPEIVVDVLRAERDAQKRAVAGVPAGAEIDLSLVKLPEDRLVFAGPNGAPLSPRVFSKAWADAAAAIGMPDVTFHALRHTHASQLIDRGVDVVTIGKRLGHASPTVTLRVYAHLFRKDDGKASDAINDALAGIGTA